MGKGFLSRNNDAQKRRWMEQKGTSASVNKGNTQMKNRPSGWEVTRQTEGEHGGMQADMMLKRYLTVLYVAQSTGSKLYHWTWLVHIWHFKASLHSDIHKVTPTAKKNLLIVTVPLGALSFKPSHTLSPGYIYHSQHTVKGPRILDRDLYNQSCSLLPCWQYLGNGTSLDVIQQINGWWKYGQITQWNSIPH